MRSFILNDDELALAVQALGGVLGDPEARLSLQTRLRTEATSVTAGNATTEEKLEALLLAISTSRAIWAAQHVSAGEDNYDRDQEEADSVIETLDGILADAGIVTTEPEPGIFNRPGENAPRKGA
jgi:hypothetical protein